MSTTDPAGYPEAVMLIPRAHDAAYAFAQSVVAALTDNPDFDPPPPELAKLADDNEKFGEANVATRGGGLVATKARKAARGKVVQDLKHVRDRVQVVAESQPTPADAAAVIVAAGMHVKRVVKRNKPPVEARWGPTSGSVLLLALRVAKVAVYFWQISLDQTNWSDEPETMKSQLLVTGLTPGQVYYFRFRARTPKGPVDYSQVVSLMVH